MMSLKGTGWAIGIAGLLALAFSGCFNSTGEDDPLVNPNLEAVLTTGSTSGPGTGIGTPGTGALSISPTSVRIPINEQMVFTAAGGEPPYVFTLISSPTMGTLAADGVYTAGPNPGTDRVRVTDGAGSRSEADVTIYNPALETNPYRIICTDFMPYSSSVTVYKGTIANPRIVNFRIENGTPSDTFNVTNESLGMPKGYIVGTREGKWQVGQTGADDGSVCDMLQVFDSSSPINVATLRIYVCNTELRIDPTFAVVPSTGSRQFTTPSTGVGANVWSMSQNQSNGNVNATGLYTPGNNTRGVIGAADVVQVRDSFSPIPQVAQARVTVPGLSVYPRKTQILPSTSTTLLALGGSGTYSWTLSSNRSNNGQSWPRTGASLSYTAGSMEGLDIVTLTDGTTGGTMTIPITVCAAISSRAYQQVTTYFPTSGTMSVMSYDLVVDDFDRDGVPDVAVPATCSSTNPTPLGDINGNEVSVLMGGTTPGSFASSSTRYTLPGSANGPWGITTGDYNADGNRDIAVSCYKTGRIIVLYGDGSGGFPNTGGATGLAYTTITVGSGANLTGIATYNFDRANGDDLVACDALGGNVYVYLSLGGGTGVAPAGFVQAAALTCTDPTSSGVTPKCYDVVVGNFNCDANGSAQRTGNGPNGIGWVDIAVSVYSHDYVIVFPATDLTTWSAANQTPYVVYSGTGGTSVRKPCNLATGYFNADVYPDLAVVNNGLGYFQTGMGVSVFLNNGTSGFTTPPTEYGLEYNYPDYYCGHLWGIVADDLDNDGRDDLAVTSRHTRQDPAYNYYYLYSYGVLVWHWDTASSSFYGFGRTDNYASVYRLSGSPYYWCPTGISTIDFGGQVHGSPGAPLPDLVVTNSCYVSGYAHYGKLIVFENRSN